LNQERQLSAKFKNLNPSLNLNKLATTAITTGIATKTRTTLSNSRASMHPQYKNSDKPGENLPAVAETSLRTT